MLFENMMSTNYKDNMVDNDQNYDNDSLESIEDIKEAADLAAYQFIHEAYFGKTKEILAIENKIAECREKYRYDPMKFNTSKEKDELDKLFEDAFGFACCSFHIDPSPVYNAYTIPASSSGFDFRDYRKFVEADKKTGFKYKKEANIYLVIYCTKGLFFSQEFTAGEITGILLHEVGYNFQDVISGRVKTCNTITQVIQLPLTLITMFLSPTSGPLRNNWINMIKYLEKNENALVNAYWYLKDIITSITSLGLGFILMLNNISALFNPIGVIQSIPKQVAEKLQHYLYMPAKIFNFYGGYRQEVVSDSFAAAYGYAEEATSGLSKIEKLSGGVVPNQIMRNAGAIGAYFDLLSLPGQLVAYFFDPHPRTIARLNNTYKYIQEELIKNENNPKMKKELQAQLNNIQNSMDKYLDLEDTGFFFSNRIDRVLLATFGGDIKSGFGKGINQDFDSAMERAEAQLKNIKK